MTDRPLTRKQHALDMARVEKSVMDAMYFREGLAENEAENTLFECLAMAAYDKAAEWLKIAEECDD